jgi:hypothetical protein
MNEVRPKRPPVRLDAKAYRELCNEVLERDGWRCQFCGSLSAVEVHHRRFRSHQGADAKRLASTPKVNRPRKPPEVAASAVGKVRRKSEGAITRLRPRRSASNPTNGATKATAKMAALTVRLTCK